MQVCIYQPAKSAMQSGSGKTSRMWVVTVESPSHKYINPLMGWIGSANTDCQVWLTFKRKEDAIAYARNNGHHYTILEPHVKQKFLKNYASNFLQKDLL